MICKRDKEIWDAALTLAHNLLIQESDRHNESDETTEARVLSDCAKRIREFLDPEDTFLEQMLLEANVNNDDGYDFLDQALNEGDGVYRP